MTPQEKEIFVKHISGSKVRWSTWLEGVYCIPDGRLNTIAGTFEAEVFDLNGDSIGASTNYISDGFDIVPYTNGVWEFYFDAKIIEIPSTPKPLEVGDRVEIIDGMFIGECGHLMQMDGRSVEIDTGEKTIFHFKSCIKSLEPAIAKIIKKKGDCICAHSLLSGGCTCGAIKPFKPWYERT